MDHGYSGKTLRQVLIDIVSDRSNYVIGKVYNFKWNEILLFQLKANPTPGQPGNGIISFNGGGWSAPTWNDLSSHFNGFTAPYNVFFASQTCPNPTDPQFQVFVLLQFEVARRMGEKQDGIPSREDVISAIDMALKVNEAGCYSHLVNMFRGHERLDAFQQIKDYVDQQAGLMLMKPLGDALPNIKK